MSQRTNVVRMGLGLLFGPAHEVRAGNGSGRIVALCGERPGSGVRFGLAGVRSGEDAVTCEGCRAVGASRDDARKARQSETGRALARRRWAR